MDLNQLVISQDLAAKKDKLPAFRQVALFGGGWLGLNIIALVISLIIRTILTSQFSDPIALDNALNHISVPASINIISYVILLVSMLALSLDFLKKIWVSFIQPSRIFKGIGYGVIILLSGIVLNVLYMVFKIELSDNANESSITAIMRSFPFFSFIAFVIAGPVCEEITYRLGLFDVLGRINRYVAYGVTFLFFGLIHFDFTSTDLINELLNLPFYVIAGLLFCYIYEREGLAVSIYAHITNNLVSFVSTLLVSDVLVRII